MVESDGRYRATPTRRISMRWQMGNAESVTSPPLLRTVASSRESSPLQEHIYAYYRELLGSTAPRHCGLAANTWGGPQVVSEEDNESLTRTFYEAELEAIVKEMKSDTAPGPDGFPVPFFKKYWGLVKQIGRAHV